MELKIPIWISHGVEPQDQITVYCLHGGQDRSHVEDYAALKVHKILHALLAPFSHCPVFLILETHSGFSAPERTYRMLCLQSATKNTMKWKNVLCPCICCEYPFIKIR
jgi:hypothetical protein